MKKLTEYPSVLDPTLVGTYPAIAKAGGGYVWDAVLEYRVWCHFEQSMRNETDSSDYYYAFASYQDALVFSEQTTGAEEPLALILQEEYIDEPESGRYTHVKARRVAEWPVVFLNRPQRTDHTIPDFINPSAPSNRLDILRGLVKV